MDQVRPWCSLPHEILSLIVSHLLVFRDTDAFHAVCKWWSETPLPIGSIHEPPYLLLPNNKLFHSIYKYSHRMQVYGDFPGAAYIHASHYGWLLVTLSKCCILFVNPFTKEKVELPDMNSIYYWPKLTFSSSPTSPDCLVFGVEQEPYCYEEEINIYTIKPGQPNWTAHSIYCKPPFRLSCNPIFFKGQYYCLGKCGSLLIYDPNRNKHRWVGPPTPPIQSHKSNIGCQYYMVECNGKLLLVFTGREGDWVNVFRLDTTKRVIWEKIDNLRETILFVSQVTSFSINAVVRGKGNKIYFPKFGGDDNELLFYSLATHKYHYVDGGRSWNNFDKTKSYPNSTWIQPCHLS